MKILWAHNFDEKMVSSGVFMYQLANAIREQGIEVDFFNMGYLRKFYRLYSLRRKLNKISAHYDILHAQFGSACGYIMGGVSGLKILSLRGSDWYGCSVARLFDRVHGKAEQILTNKSVKRYDKILLMSERMRNDVSGRFPNAPISILPDGIDLSLFQPMERLMARSKLGEGADDSSWILYPTLQENNPVKRLNLARQTYQETQKYLPDVKFKFACNIPHDQMPLMVNASNVVLMTSTHEGWPNCVKEALACNIPFVTTDVSDLATISQQTQSCFVCDPDPKLIADAVVKAIDSPRENLRRFVQAMDIQIIAKKLITIYQELIDTS